MRALLALATLTAALPLLCAAGLVMVAGYAIATVGLVAWSAVLWLVNPSFDALRRSPAREER